MRCALRVVKFAQIQFATAVNNTHHRPVPWLLSVMRPLGCAPAFV